uniref:Chemosensory protein 5 n=1 Tax=Propsilocerus akamusi TaxID=903466 RepID=A0A7D0TCV7_9DIPT|nr:chemosensory protein 5 [Propsilocerus akamusi]
MHREAARRNREGDQISDREEANRIQRAGEEVRPPGQLQAQIPG